MIRSIDAVLVGAFFPRARPTATPAFHSSMEELATSSHLCTATRARMGDLSATLIFHAAAAT